MDKCNFLCAFLYLWISYVQHEFKNNLNNDLKNQVLNRKRSLVIFVVLFSFVGLITYQFSKVI